MTDIPSNTSERISSLSNEQEKNAQGKSVTVKKQPQQITMFFKSNKPEKA